MPEFVLNVGNGQTWLDSLDDFTRGYVEAAFFTSTHGENGEKELNETHSAGDISPELREQIVADCRAFQRDNAIDISAGCLLPDGAEFTADWRAGTDFWYTRNGHGVGFWETDRWAAEAGERLDKAAEAAGRFDLYPGDDGKVYGSRG